MKRIKLKDAYEAKEAFDKGVDVYHGETSSRTWMIKEGNSIGELLNNSSEFWIEEPTAEDEILKQAKEICYKTFKVKHKDWDDGSWSSVCEVSNTVSGYFFIIGDRNYIPQEIVDSFESYDPRKELEE